MANKYKNLTFSEGYNRKEMTPDEIISEIDRMNGRRNPFFFNGQPYFTARAVEVDESDVRVVFKFYTESRVRNISGLYWGDQYEAHTWIQKDRIIGWEMVDVYCGKEYCGSYRNILIR